MDIETLYHDIAEVCPIIEAFVGDPDDNATWSFTPARGASLEQIEAGKRVIDPTSGAGYVPDPIPQPMPLPAAMPKHRGVPMKSDIQIIVDLRQALGRDPTREELGAERTRLYQLWHDEFTKSVDAPPPAPNAKDNRRS